MIFFKKKAGYELRDASYELGKSVNRDQLSALPSACGLFDRVPNFEVR